MGFQINRILARFLYMLMLTVVIPVSFASGNEIETARENCAQVESPLNAALGCQIHIDCLYYSATINCSESTLVALTNTCRGLEFTLCVDVATLTTIAIEDAIVNYQPIDSTIHLNNSLKAFVEGRYQNAIDLYENITLAIDYFPHYILELGLGVIYLRINNPDVALIQFDKSLNMEFYNPVAFYYRGNTYVERGNDVRALRDHYMYDLLGDSRLKATLPLRAFTIQIPNTEPWNLYPIYTLERGEVITRVANDTADPVQPIVVSFLDNYETLVIADWLDIVAGTETEILFFERDPENPLRYILNINQQDVPDSIVSGKTEISVITNPFTLELYLRSTQSNQTRLVTAIASQPAESDIRPVNDTAFCEFVPFSLLKIGMTIQNLPPDSEWILWDDPAFENPMNLRDEDVNRDAFKVINGSFCYDDQLWWQVSNGTVTGWLPEYEKLSPYTLHVAPVDLLTKWQEEPPTPLQFLNLVDE